MIGPAPKSCSQLCICLDLELAMTDNPLEIGRQEDQRRAWKIVKDDGTSFPAR